MKTLRSLVVATLSVAVLTTPNSVLAYAITIGAPAAPNNSFTANANVAVTGDIAWTVDPSRMINEPRPTACVLTFKNETGGVIASQNATITVTQTPNPPSTTVGHEDFQGSFTMPAAVDNGEQFSIDAVPYVFGSTIQVQGGTLSATAFISGKT